MSAEPLRPKPTAGPSADNATPRDGAGAEQGRSRRRRGRRRGGHRRMSSAPPPGAATTDGATESHADSHPSSAVQAGAGAPTPGQQSGAAHLGTTPPQSPQKNSPQNNSGQKSSAERNNGGSRRRRNRRRKPSRPTVEGAEAVAGSRAPDARIPGGVDSSDTPIPRENARVVVKPSDVSALGKPRRARPERDKPRTRAATPAEAPPVRLRTVRETSAGGLVVRGLDADPDSRCAVLIGRVDRRGRMMWSLPKGHIETGETAEQTAIREVSEETGITGRVVAPLGKIDYWFVSDGKRIHKTVHHYLMRSLGGELSDADYEVAEVAWVPLSELPRRLTYSDERRLARVAGDVIEQLGNDPERMARSEADSLRTQPNEYERAAADRNQRRNDPPRPARNRRRRGHRGSGKTNPAQHRDPSHQHSDSASRRNDASAAPEPSRRDE